MSKVRRLLFATCHEATAIFTGAERYAIMTPKPAMSELITCNFYRLCANTNTKRYKNIRKVSILPSPVQPNPMDVLLNLRLGNKGYASNGQSVFVNVVLSALACGSCPVECFLLRLVSQYLPLGQQAPIPANIWKAILR
eukprot:3320278-Amphidinium_carterae.1